MIVKWKHLAYGFKQASIRKQQALLLSLGSIFVLVACGQQATLPASSMRTQQDCMVMAKGEMTAQYIPDCDPYNPPDDPTPPVPVKPALSIIPLEEVQAKAERLGVSLAEAALPNIEGYLQYKTKVARGGDWPNNSTSRQDFINRLFAYAGNTPPVKVINKSGYSNDANCRVRTVDAKLVSENMGFLDDNVSTFYPGALLQGQLLNGASPTTVPIHVPYTMRSPIHLTSNLYVSEIANSPTASGVLDAIGSMIRKGGGYAKSSLVFQRSSASNIEGALTEFGLDANVMGASIKGTFNQSSEKSSNTEFVYLFQSLFTVDVDTLGYTPVNGLFNDQFQVPQLQALASQGEIGYNNLPLFVKSVTFGRILVFSMTSNASKEELQAAIDAKYRNVSANLSYRQHKIINNSQIKVFAVGGPFKVQADMLKSGDWKSYFDDTQLDLNTLKPISHRINRWDDIKAVTQRIDRYQERYCPGTLPRDIKLVLSDVKGSMAVTRNLAPSYNPVVVHNGGDTVIDITAMAGTNDTFNFFLTGYRPNWVSRWQGSASLRLEVDGITQFQDTKSFVGEHSQQAFFCEVRDMVAGNASCSRQ